MESCDFCILDEFEGSYGYFSTKYHFLGPPCYPVCVEAGYYFSVSELHSETLCLGYQEVKEDGKHRK